MADKKPDPFAAYQQPIAAGDPFASYQQPVAAPVKQGFFDSALESSGLKGIGQAIMHPVDAANNFGPGIIKMIGDSGVDFQKGVDNYKKEGLTQTTRREFGRSIPIVGPLLDKAQTQYDQGDIAGMGGTLAGFVGGMAAPAVAGKLVKGIPAALTGAGAVAEDSGVGLLNKTVGAIKPDFKRGVNPGQAYLDAGGGPALSMGNLAEKSAALKDHVGAKLGTAYKDATAAGTKIPQSRVAGALLPSIQDAISTVTGEGGGGVDAAKPYQDYAGTFKALSPSVGSGDFTPSDVFATKRNIANNTNFSEPSQVGLKQVRQQNVGALSGLLSDVVPETSALNRQYAGLGKFADRAELRAQTHSMPLSSIVTKGGLSTAGALMGGAEGGASHALAGSLLGLAADSIPVKSALASGLYYGGKGLTAAGDVASPLSRFPAIPIAPYNLYAQKKKRDEE